MTERADFLLPNEQFSSASTLRIAKTKCPAFDKSLPVIAFQKNRRLAGLLRLQTFVNSRYETSLIILLFGGGTHHVKSPLLLRPGSGM